MSNKSYDVVIIGSGPGGYVCAIRCAQLGLKVACVEKTNLGGTCLNIGCIPSKALLTASHKFEDIDHMEAMGITADNISFDLERVMKHKTDVVDANTQGIGFLFKKNKIDHVVGLGTVIDANTVSVKSDSGDVSTLKTNSIVIATGSEVTPLPGIEIDEKNIVSSTGALDLDDVPEKLVVIGGGVIGLELGTVWRRLGAEVTIIEFMGKILPPMDDEISKEMKKILTKQGMKFKLNTKVTSAKVNKDKVTLSMEPSKGGEVVTLDADKVLVAIGRRPFVTGLGLENAGVKLNERGQVDVNDYFETSIAGIYAIGDVIRGPMLAHKAEDEGVVLAEILAGETGHINYDAIPGVVYTHPEAADVGKTEQQLKADGVKYKVGKFPYMANGRARSMNEMDGFVKILSDAKTDRILGCHIIGAEAGTMIGEVVLAMEFGASAEDIARTCHAHPTLSEVIKEAALAVDNREIHM